MKNLVVVFLVAFTTSLSGQSFPESPFIYPALLNTEDATVRLLNRINQYRSENGLNPLPFDTAMTNACAYHCNYKSLDTAKVSLHTESYLGNAKNVMKPIPYFETRMSHFNVKLKGNRRSEICCKGPGNFVHNPAYSQYAIKMGESCKAGKCDPSAVTEYVFQMWKSSKSHNESMLSPNGRMAGCYQYVYEKDGVYWVMAACLINSHKPYDPGEE
jgi:uncharacterized protein YkwD